MPTANGPVTVWSGDGFQLGHGRGEVKFGRMPEGYGRKTIGELREMTWLPAQEATVGEPTTAPPTYRVVFFGGPAFRAVFPEGGPDTTQDQATFVPSPLPATWMQPHSTR